MPAMMSESHRLGECSLDLCLTQANFKVRTLELEHAADVFHRAGNNFERLKPSAVDQQLREAHDVTLKAPVHKKKYTMSEYPVYEKKYTMSEAPVYEKK